MMLAVALDSFYFFNLISLARPSSPMFNRSGRRVDILVMFLTVGQKLSVFCIMLSLGFSYAAFFILRRFPSVSNLLGDFFLKGIELWQVLLLHQLK